MKRSVPRKSGQTQAPNAPKTAGPLQARADRSAPVRKLADLSTQAAKAPVQRKTLMEEVYRRGRRGQPPHREKGVETSRGFDDNHLVSGPVSPEVSEARARDRGKAKNTVVSEAQMSAQVRTHRDALVDAANKDETVSLSFPSGTAYQTIKTNNTQSGYNTAESNEVKVMAGTHGATRNYVRIYHLEESDFVMNIQNEDLFPSLGGDKKT